MPRPNRPEWQGEDRYARRHELYVRAAPVFERHGYGGSTLKALADACDISIPGLYRYFPSKRAFALYPLPPLYPELQRPAPDLTTGDPATLLSWWIEAAVSERPYYLLALRLALEAGLTAEEDARVTSNLGDHAKQLGHVIARAAPHLGGDGAVQVATAMIELTTAPALSRLRREPGDLRRDLRALLRGYGIVLPLTTPSPT